MPEPSEPPQPTTVTTVEGALVALIQGNSAVMAIASAIYPFSDWRSPGLPKITYWRWGTDRGSESGGNSNDGPTGHAVAKFYLDCWAIDQLAAKQLATAIRKAVNGYAGSQGNITINALRVADEREQPGALIPGQEKPIQRVTLDVRMQFQDS